MNRLKSVIIRQLSLFKIPEYCLCWALLIATAYIMLG